MEALFFSFSKRKNSTKVPVDSTGTAFNITLKEPTSMDAPALVLSADTFSFNYCKFNDQYFFVSQIVSRRNNLWEVQLEKDVLATFRTQILGTSAYVLYDNQGNSEIVDNRLAIKTSRTLAENSVAFPDIDTTGCYAITVVGEGSTAVYLVSNPAAVVSSTAFNNVIADIEYDVSSITPQSSLESIVLALVKQTYNNGSRVIQSTSALDAIKSCVWLPFPQSLFWGNQREIKLGKYPTGVTAKYIGGGNQFAQLTQTTVAIPWQATDWRRNSPYTQVYLYIPFIGVVNIPASQLTGEEALTILASVSATGDLCVNVVQGTQVLGSYGANCGVQVPIGNSNATPKNLVNTIIGAISAGVATASLGIGAGAAALSGVAVAAAGNIAGVPTCVGGLGSGAAMGLSRNIICFTSFHDTSVAPASVASAIGLPAFAVKQISTLSGYVQCHEFSLNSAAESGDLDTVNNYMNSGVFIE